MFWLICRRLLIGLVTLWAVSVVVFLGTEILPGDVAEIILGQASTPETLSVLRRELGLDQPAPLRYVTWLTDMLAGDFGRSLAGGAAVADLISGRLANTTLLAGLVAAIAVPLSVTLGIVAASYPGTWIDRGVSFATLAVISVPEFLTAILLVLLLAVELRWLPAIAHLRGDEDFARVMAALALPILTLTIAITGQMVRLTRASILNILDAPFIEMAILKGVPRRRIVMRHALRNAVGPIVNVVAINLAYLVSGVVIVETVFAYPGLAKLMIDAVQSRDLPLVQACAMIFCTTYVMLILIADIAAITANPRLRHPR